MSSWMTGKSAMSVERVILLSLVSKQSIASILAIVSMGWVWVLGNITRIRIIIVKCVVIKHHIIYMHIKIIYDIISA